jgi:hypothetical protein
MIDPAQRPYVIAQYVSGRTLRSIAAELSVHKSAVHNCWVAAGKPKRIRGRTYRKNGQETIESALEMYVDGVSAKRVSALTGVRPGTLRYYWRRLGRPTRNLTRTVGGAPCRHDPFLSKEFVRRRMAGEGFMSLCRELAIPPSTATWWMERYRDEPYRRVRRPAPPEPVVVREEVPYIPFTRPGKVYRFAPLPATMWQPINVSPNDDARRGVSSEEMKHALIDTLMAESDFDEDRRLGVAAFLGAEYGISWTLADIGILIGVTRERVRQIAERAVEKLTAGLALNGELDMSEDDFEDPEHSETYAEYAEAISAT